MTIHEVSRRLGISKGTIWRALNNADDINPNTRERVLRQLDEIGYRPSRMAQALSTGRSRVVSVWMGSLTSPYTSTVLYHLEQCIVRSSYDMLLRNLSYRSMNVDMRRLTADWPTDGILVLDSIPWVQYAIECNRDNPKPLVSMGVYCETSIDYVQIDLYEPFVAAMRHLWEQGCRRIAFLAPERYMNQQQGRYRAYCEVTQEMGMPQQHIVADRIHRRDAMEAVSAYIATGASFDAILAFNDLHAIGAYRALRSHGIQVPNEVALVGCDGLEETEYYEHPLSTIIMPIPEMCEMAWQFLRDQIQEPDQEPRSAILSAKLEIRDSSTRTTRKT